MAYYEVFEIQEGYSNITDTGMEAICTCTLIKGKFNCIVNTMIPSNGEQLLRALVDHQLKPNDIHYVISSNGDSGYIGNNHLFLESTHIVGHSISMKDTYYPNSLSHDKPFKIDGEKLQILPTPGRTLVDITVLVKISRGCAVAITGGLIEKKEDLRNSYIWLIPRPECPALQRYNRSKIIKLASRIIPGHGEGFEVSKDVRESFLAHKYFEKSKNNYHYSKYISYSGYFSILTKFRNSGRVMRKKKISPGDKTSKVQCLGHHASKQQSLVNCKFRYPDLGRKMGYGVDIVQEGYYNEEKDGTVKKNCTCTLIKGNVNVIVDTLTPWDSSHILSELTKHELQPSDINYVISTQPSYGFSGNNFLFENSYHIVGHTYTQKNMYLFEPFTYGNPLYIDGDDLKVIPTPGCTLKDVSVLVKTTDGTVAVTGALFENKDDLSNDYESIRYCKGSFFPQIQIHSRRLIIKLADYIIPGYGGMFQVTESIKNSFVDRYNSLI